MDEPMCSCGCGEPIPVKHLFRYKTPYLLRGHVPREPLMCQCGCGLPIPWRDNYRTIPAKTLPGHVSPVERASYLSRRTRHRVDEPVVCACGCGLVVPPHPSGYPHQFVSGHNRRGLPRPDLGDGRYISTEGYVMAYVGSHPLYMQPGRYVGEHRLIVENELGRRLVDGEVVHHINHVRNDNRRENLLLMDRPDHATLHLEPSWGRKRRRKAAHQ